MSESDKNTLSRRISQELPGQTLSNVLQNAMKNEFVVGNVSIDNSDILLYKSTKTNKFGLFLDHTYTHPASDTAPKADNQ